MTETNSHAALTSRLAASETSPEPLLVIRSFAEGWKLHYIECDVHEVIECLRQMLASLEAEHGKQHEADSHARLTSRLAASATSVDQIAGTPV